METQNEMNRLPDRPKACFASIEKSGPLHELRESRYAVPKVMVPQRSDFTGSLGSPSSSGSSSRRYFPMAE
jgi:hypothetical protein